MKYQVEWETDAADALDKLDSVAIQRVLLRITWLSLNIDSIIPQPLVGNLKGYYKFRIGQYRIVYGIDRKNKIIIIEYVGHRRDVYKDK